MSLFIDITAGRTTLDTHLAAVRRHPDPRVASLEGWAALTQAAVTAVAELRTTHLNNPWRQAKTTAGSPKRAAALAMTRLDTELSNYLSTGQVSQALAVPSGTRAAMQRAMAPDQDGGGWRPSFSFNFLGGVALSAAMLDYAGRLDQAPAGFERARSTVAPLIAEAASVYGNIFRANQRESAEKTARGQATGDMLARAVRMGAGTRWKADAASAFIQQYFFRMAPGKSAEFEEVYRPVVDQAEAWAANAIAVIEQNANEYCALAGCSNPGSVARLFVGRGLIDIPKTSMPTMRLQIAQYFAAEASRQGWTEPDLAVRISDPLVREHVSQAVGTNQRIEFQAIETARQEQFARHAAQEAARAREEAARVAAQLANAADARQAEAARLQALEAARLATELAAEEAAREQAAREALARAREEAEIARRLAEEEGARAATALEAESARRAAAAAAAAEAEAQRLALEAAAAAEVSVTPPIIPVPPSVPAPAVPPINALPPAPAPAPVVIGTAPIIPRITPTGGMCQ